MFSERQIEFLSDCADLQARATRGLSIVSAIHQFNCHRKNIFLAPEKIFPPRFSEYLIYKEDVRCSL